MGGYMQQTNGSLSADEKAFCALLARIMRRCIAEGDERIMGILRSTPVQEEGK